MGTQTQRAYKLWSWWLPNAHDDRVKCYSRHRVPMSKLFGRFHCKVSGMLCCVRLRNPPDPSPYTVEETLRILNGRSPLPNMHYHINVVLVSLTFFQSTNVNTTLLQTGIKLYLQLYFTSALLLIFMCCSIKVTCAAGFSLRVKVRVFTHSDTKVPLQLLCLPC